MKNKAPSMAQLTSRRDFSPLRNVIVLAATVVFCCVSLATPTSLVFAAAHIAPVSPLTRAALHHPSASLPPARAAVHRTTHVQALVSTGALCSGTHCNGLNPYATNCIGQSWDRVWVVKSALIKNNQGRQLGYVELWYSATCQTNWAKTVAQVPYVQIAANLRIQGDSADHYVVTTSPDQYVVISPQMYAPVALAGATGWIWSSVSAPAASACATQDSGALCYMLH